MIEFADPRSAPGAPLVDYRDLVDPGRLRRPVGLHSNGYFDAAAFLAHLGAALGFETRAYVKGKFSEISTRLDEQKLNELAQECGALVLAYGHCGSCTSATVRDGVAAARLGVPVVVCVTEYFAEEARHIAEAAGVKNLPLALLPHPMAGTGDAALAHTAKAVAPAVRALLEQGAP